MTDAQAGLSPELVGRLQRALSADGDELFQVLLDPAAEVLRTALRNRRLTEEHLLAMLRRNDLPEDLLKQVAQLERFADSHRIQVALAANPGTPGTLLQTLLPRLFLFELLNLCLLPGAGPDQKVAAERAILQRLPTTELGNKLTLARRGTPTLVAELVKEGEPRVVEACLGSPRLREVAIVQFLNGARATADTISSIARHERWKSRPNVRMAILKNPRTPQVWYTLFLPLLTTPEVGTLLLTRRLTPSQRQLVTEEAGKRGLKGMRLPGRGRSTREI